MVIHLGFGITSAMRRPATAVETALGICFGPIGDKIGSAVKLALAAEQNRYRGAVEAIHEAAQF
jgi:hypothetical protein